MNTIWIIAIVLGAFILLGPIMLLTAKLNKVDPYILDKSDEEKEKDTKSFIIVNLLRPLFLPLWFETRFLKWIGILKK